MDKDGTEDNQMVNQSGGATTSDLRTISPIRSHTDVGASDKASDDDMAKSKDLTIPTHIKPTLHPYIKKAFKTFESLDCLVIDMVVFGGPSRT